ncbi:MAG: bifunctional hydroxymethylpyrimidine kinase/phosphomethylpyrimidine kinase [Cyanobacteria bacterium P01_F01_bin.150]
MNSIPVALTIAGSDSGGGAGIQADLRTFAFHQVHGASALTCITAQNTIGVNRVDVMTAEAVIAQINAVVDDIGIDALKTGMLPNQEIIEAVAATIKSRKTTIPALAVVVDPVMVSRAGAKLIEDSAIAALIQDLIPLATILTPNRYEAEILSQQPIRTLEEMREAAQNILLLGPQAVIVKGGGMTGELKGVDIVAIRQQEGSPKSHILQTKAVETKDTHGTGCTLSAAITANLALGQESMNAIGQAKDYVTEALRHSLRIGKGQGPVGHFFPLRLSSPPGHTPLAEA